MASTARGFEHTEPSNLQLHDLTDRREHRIRSLATMAAISFTEGNHRWRTQTTVLHVSPIEGSSRVPSVED